MINMNWDWIATTIDKNGNIWGIDNSKGENLYCCCTQSGLTKISVGSNDNEKHYINAVSYNEELILIPDILGSIDIINKESLSVREINIPYRELMSVKNKIPFFHGFINDKFLYLLGYAYPGIVKVDLEKEKSTVIDGWVSLTNLNDFNDGFFHMKSVEIDGVIYCPFMNQNAVLRYDLRTDDADIVRVGDDKQRFISIEHDGNSIWLIPRDNRNGNIIRWNPIANETTYYNDFPPEFDHNLYAFYRTVYYDSRIFLFSHMSNINVCLDTNTGKMSSFQHLYDVDEVKKCKYPNLILIENKIFFLINMELVIWDLNTGDIERKPIKISEKLISEIEKQEMERYREKSDGLFRENSQTSLDRFLKYISCIEK